MDELTPEQQFAAEEAGIIVARGLLAGRPRPRIEADLHQLDWAPGAADRFISRVERDLERFTQSEESRRQMRRENRRDVLGGALLMILGLVSVGVLAVIVLSLRLTVGVMIGLVVPGACLMYRGWTRGELVRYLERATRERDEQNRAGDW